MRAWKRLILSVQPSLRGRVFALLAGLTLCACAGAGATYWLAQHYLDATDTLRQVNLRQQVAALSFSEQLSRLEADALAARQDPSRRGDFLARQKSVEKALVQLRAAETLEAGRGLITRMDGGYRSQALVLRSLVDSRPGEGAALVARAARSRQEAQEAAGDLFSLHSRDADIGVSTMRTLARVATTASLFVIPVGAVLGLLLGWVLIRQVLGPIRRLALGGLAAAGSVESSGEEAAERPAAATSADASADPPATPPAKRSNEVLAVGELVAGLLHDVDEAQTLLKESREHLVQSEKMALVGKLAAGVAHSIRNPLTSVKMRLFSLERGLDLSSTQREDFEVISEEIRHLDTIIRNFLEFSRPPKPKLQRMSLSTVVDMTLVLLKHRLETYGVEVLIRRERPLPAIWLDPEQLKEVLVNLALNACDAMGENGRITITENAGFLEPLGQVAILEIADSGPGVSPEVAERIFQPFFSTKEEGTGLGLAIARRILEEHGGYIHLKPTERGEPGACFVIVLPIAERPWLRS